MERKRLSPKNILRALGVFLFAYLSSGCMPQDQSACYQAEVGNLACAKDLHSAVETTQARAVEEIVKTALASAAPTETQQPTTTPIPGLYEPCGVPQNGEGIYAFVDRLNGEAEVTGKEHVMVEGVIYEMEEYIRKGVVLPEGKMSCWGVDRKSLEEGVKTFMGDLRQATPSR